MDGSFHGGISKDGSLAVTGASLLRARMVNKGDDLNNSMDTLWYNGEQACNVSLAQDGSKRTAFLDFGGKTGRAYVGKKYGTHQFLLIADSTGTLTQYAAAPAGYTFDHTEWAVGTANENLVATLTNANGAHKKITLVNLTENSIMDLAEGDELWHPSLWIKTRKAIAKSSSSAAEAIPESSESTEGNTSIDDKITVELNPDSAGMYYNNSGAYEYAINWRYKMEFLWMYRNTTNVAIIGSSRTYNGVKPLLFTEPISAINFAVSQNTQAGAHFHLVNYILPHTENLKVVISPIDIDRWHMTSKKLFETAYKSYPGYVYDANHNFWKDGFPKGLDTLTYESYGVTNFGNKERKQKGFREEISASWGTASLSTDSTWLQSKPQAYSSNFNLLIDMIEKCAQKNIIFIGVITPQNPKFKDTGAFGVHGLRRSEASALIQEIADISKQYPNFILMDENKMGEHDYTDEMAFDNNHLSELGAKQLTHRLGSLIQTLNIDFEN